MTKRQTTAAVLVNISDIFVLFLTAVEITSEKSEEKEFQAMK